MTPFYKKAAAWPEFDLQLFAGEPYAVQGELESLGWGKEVTFGVPPPSTVNIWHCFKTWGGKMTTMQVARAPRMSLADPYPGTGGRSGAGSLDVETDADTFPAVLAYTLGNQVITLASPYYTGTVQTTGGIKINDLGMTVSTNSVTGTLNLVTLLFPGMQLDVDTATNKETFTITTVGAPDPVSGKIVLTGYVGTPGTGFTKVHALGTVVTGTSTHPLNVMTLGAPLPTFTQQVTRPGGGTVAAGVCTDYLGCKIDSLALSYASKQGLQAKLALVFRDMLVDTATIIPAVLSNKNPYIFEQGFVPTYFTESLIGNNASMLAFNITINNNLLKDYFTGGTGNLVRSFPEQKRTLSGTMQMGFESQAALNAFNAAAAGGALPPTSLSIPLQNTDPIGASGVPWAVWLYFPKVFIGDWTAADDTSKTVTQTLTLTFAESVPGANDQMTAFCMVGQNTKY